jgi:hypothetical protein
MFNVSLIGGPISGTAYREEYLPGRVYTYGAEDAEYVEFLASKGRFVIQQIDKQEPEAPQADIEPAPAAPVAEKAPEAPSSKAQPKAKKK